MLFSPYAWMGFAILRRYRDYWGDRIDVEFVPFFLGGIMVGAKNRPPAAIPGTCLPKTFSFKNLRGSESEVRVLRCC